MLQEKSQDVAEVQDSTLPTTSAERVLLTRVIGGNTNLAGKLAESTLVVIPEGFMTESLDTASDRGELCCRNSFTTTTTKLKINFRPGEPDVGFNH